MKKLIAFALVIVSLFALMAGCQSESDKPVLKVSISPDFAPMEFVDPTKTGQDKFVGFDIFLAKFIAEELGMELELMPMDFDACQAAVASGKVDMSISGFSWSEKREQNYNLSDYYYAGENETEQVLITLEGNKIKFADGASLDGLKIGAQAASIQEELVATQLPNCQLVVYTDINTGLLQLKKGDFDAMAVAIGNANALISNNPEVVMSGFEFEVDEKMLNNLILLQKGNDDLTAKVNAALAKAEAAGYYEKWYEDALNIAGVDVSYDVDGNPITEPTGEAAETTEAAVETTGAAE